jgi:uncharacterized phage protein (TIGR02218 family)
MRTIPTALQDKLDTGVTTLCRCWIVTRTDGEVQGFTDHDRDIVLAAVLPEPLTCRAGTGLAASEATEQLGLAVQASEISGALAADSLTETDLAGGRYDGAEIKVYLVDWSDPALNVLLARGVLGEVRREGQAFAAEFRSLAHRLAEDSGRLYTATCSADLGDARCTIDLANPAYRGTGMVETVSATSVFYASGLGAFADGWFTAGKLAFTSGANAGLAMEVKRHRFDLAGVLIELWQIMPEPIVAGDTFTVTAGCDKRFTTCRDRFANTINFRGFPHIPGNDFIIRVPTPGAPGSDGRSKFADA